MAMLPTLPLVKRVTIMVNQLCRYILPGNVAEKCFRAQGRNEGNDSITSRFAVLSNYVPGPGFLRRFQFLGGSHIPTCGHVLLCRSCIKLDGHSVIKLTSRKNKRRITMRPYGQLNRNPSKFVSEYSCFLNVKVQCNIRGRESQYFGGAENTEFTMCSCL